jgi:hypothetical protein
MEIGKEGRYGNVTLTDGRDGKLPCISVALFSTQLLQCCADLGMVAYTVS